MASFYISKGLSVKEKSNLHGIVKVCSKIIEAQQEDLRSLWEKRAEQKAKIIISQADHLLAREFSLMPSGRRYYAPSHRTNRYANYFIPSYIKLLKNAECSCL